MSTAKAAIQSNNSTRPPIVTVMGHVDHGKTSILDAFRKTTIAAKEHAGITQHIGAYQITHTTPSGSQKITFIDTPGHAAFSQMRSRGGRVADIVVLVVSGEEGVKAQTKEVIAHAQVAKTPIIVALNKMDLPTFNAQKAKQELAAANVLVEDWGGEVVCVEVSAKTGKNLDKLLDAILALAEILDLKADLAGELEAVIIEARLDRKKGALVSCIVKNGKITKGDRIVASGVEATVRFLTSASGETVNEALPSDPVEILGFKTLPKVGDTIVAAGSELAELAIDEDRVEIVGKNTKKIVTIVVRADTQGTLEAVKAGLADLVTSSVGATFSLKFLLCATGDITDSDILSAHASKGIVVGFNVRAPSHVAEFAEDLQIPVKIYQTIYELIDDVKDVLIGTASAAEAKIKGRAQVLKLFKLESGDVILGCKVLAGALKPDSKVTIYDKDPADLKPEDLPVFTGHIKKLKKGKEEVNVVGKDNDCGVLLKPSFDQAKEGLWIEVV